MRSWDRYVYLLVESVLRKGIESKEEIIRGSDSNMRLVFVGKGVYLEINTDLLIIPDICHERHEYIRINFCWQV